MTLIIAMSKPEGIYLSVDYRVTDARTHKLIDDKTIKHLTIQYPPAYGPKVLLGFTGLAKLPDGTPMLTWIRETLRGRTEVIDVSMQHLLSRLNRDIARYLVPLTINLLVLEKNSRRLFGALTNQRVTPLGVVTEPKFDYVMRELDEWMLLANGSGALRLAKNGHLDRLRPHLNVVPREPMNHMKLLSIINRQVARKDKGVSPFCHVSFINSDDRFAPASHAFTERGESVPFEMTTISNGLDLTDLAEVFNAYAQRYFKTGTNDTTELKMSIEGIKLDRRP